MNCIYLLLAFLIGFPTQKTKSCNVEKIYNVVELSSVSYGAKVLANGQVFDNYDTKILVPTDLSSGLYDLSVTTEDGDFFSADNGTIYLETSSCYKYVYGESVVLKWSGYSGTLLFDD